MSFRTLLVIKAVVCLIFGVLLLTVPGPLFALLGGPLTAAGRFAAREYAAAMIGTLFLTWLARNVQAGDARRAIVADLLVYDAIGVVISVAAVVSGVLGTLGWGVMAVYLFFTVGSAWVLRDLSGPAFGPAPA